MRSVDGLTRYPLWRSARSARDAGTRFTGGVYVQVIARGSGRGWLPSSLGGYLFAEGVPRPTGRGREEVDRRRGLSSGNRACPHWATRARGAELAADEPVRHRWP